MADTARQINDRGLSIVMFTDHGELPGKEFVDEVAKQTKALILRGVELNVFADAFEKPKDKIGRQAFFHLLVGFDPQGQFNEDYWLNRIYHACGKETRSIGSQEIIGIPGDICKIIEALEGSNAIIIPAHLHTKSDTFSSRSIDDIYTDEKFLSFLAKFTALEVVDEGTAVFFDGKHPETKMSKRRASSRAMRMRPPEWALGQRGY